MWEIVGILALVLLGIAAICTITYFILKAASYFKRTFGKSLWPGVIALCLSLDLAIAAAMCSQDEASRTLTTVLIVASTVLFAYCLYRDIRFYRIYSIPAFLLQLLLAVVQVMMIIIVFLSKSSKSTGAYRSERVRQRAARLGYILDI